MSEVGIIMIGGGPRSLTVLERIATTECRSKDDIVIHVVDPGNPGEGSHPSSQSEHMLTNTLASQVTLYPHSSARYGDELTPDFTQWARRVSYRQIGDAFVQGDSGEAISDEHYLPRPLLGLYLSDCFHAIKSRLPANVTLIHHRTTANDMRVSGNDRIRVTLDGGQVLEADYAFLLTGHCRSRPDAFARAMTDFARAKNKDDARVCFIPHVYPTSQLKIISPEATVAIQGLGLTSYDVVASLTLDRGGRFKGEMPNLVYEASGREPKILLFSRYGLPYAARGRNEKGISGRHEAKIFTSEAVDQLRRHSTDQTLDFELQVLPLLRKEMVLAFRTAATRSRRGVSRYYVEDAELAVEALINSSSIAHQNFASFRSAVLDYLRHDLQEALLGNLTSPLKAATDVIRDCRAAIATAVEHRGLTPASHRWFIEKFVPTMNRLSFGPPLRRNAQLLALIEAGVVDWGGGPGCRVVADPCRSRYWLETDFAESPYLSGAEVLVVARLPAFRPEQDESLLYQNLIRRGTIRSFFNGDYHPGGLDVDDRHHPISASGEPLRNVWALGYPCEGPRFYTYAMPRPLRHSVQSQDAEEAVAELSHLISAMPRKLAPDSDKLVLSSPALPVQS